MAEEASPSPHPPRRQQRKKKKSEKLTKDGPADSDRLESLRWNESLPSDDPFVLLAGSNEGGFLSLDEIEEADYGFVEGIPDPIVGAKKKEKKRKRVDGEGGEGGEDGDVKGNKRKKKKRKIRSKNTKEKADPEKDVAEENKDGFLEGKVEDVQNDTNGGNLKGDNDNELILGEDEVYAWNELRLHPLLIKSIRRLGFKEPTPIQRACIPAAAHQGKDVIGAAETGSGKTLAFGLPILQRLLEEREKVARLTRDNSNPNIRGGLLRALVVTPTRELALQVSDHLKKAAKFLDILVVPIVGGMSSEKQERLLKRRPEIIVGTPGRLWELMSAGDQHLVELHSLSFFVLDEADRMIEHGHFHELQSIIDMLPVIDGCVEQSSQCTPTCKTVPNLQRKKRQTFVFSATIALSDNFRKKLKRGLSIPKSSMSDNLSSIEALSERAGMKPDAAIFDLTNASIVANKLEESFIDCSEEDKDAYLYYILSVHGQGRTIVFCTSIAALRHISSILRILGVNAWTLHAQMQQRARLKAIDRFRGNENAVLVATDVAARGLDIPHVRTVVHYQLPHSAEVYIHRSGRTARASADGCCIALISPSDKTKFFSLCKSLSRESLRQFPIDDAYMPEVTKRLSLAHQIDKIMRKNSQENSKNNWFKRNAESVELAMDVSDSEEERVKDFKEKKTTSAHLKKLQQELNDHIARPMQPKSFSRRFFAGAGVTPILQQQLEELSKKNAVGRLNLREKKGSGFVVIGQDCIEPLQALRSSGHEVCFNVEKKREIQRQAETWKRKKREEKKNSREQKRKQKRKAKEGMK